jgi:hypothetical protein
MANCATRSCLLPTTRTCRPRIVKERRYGEVSAVVGLVITQMAGSIPTAMRQPALPCWSVTASLSCSAFPGDW